MKQDFKLSPDNWTPRKGFSQKEKGKGKVSTGQFPETVPVTLAHVPSSIFLGIHGEKAD